MPIDDRSSRPSLPDARLGSAFAYWQHKRGERHMPRRADFDPVDMPGLLPFIRLVDVHGPGQYRYRVVGTELEQFHGGLKFAGRFVHEALPPHLADHVIPVYDECVRECRPIYIENTFRMSDAERVARRSRVLFLPLSEDDETVSMVLVVQLITTLDSSAAEAFDAWASHYTELDRRLL
ncbi:MAG TPA: PAS domain-containing protein [Dongiaceae bacterium]|jgi:hypothetical protein|nr:PAS domain-containing protein [Dongiaceae bacterium]